MTEVCGRWNLRERKSIRTAPRAGTKKGRRVQLGSSGVRLQGSLPRLCPRIAMTMAMMQAGEAEVGLTNSCVCQLFIGHLDSTWPGECSGRRGVEGYSVSYLCQLFMGHLGSTWPGECSGRQEGGAPCVTPESDGNGRHQPICHQAKPCTFQSHANL